MKIAIVDYGAGNTSSVQFAFERLGYKPVLSSDPNILRAADGVIFPGVGNAGAASNILAEKGLVDVIKNLKKPVLGICLGMQLLCETSEEASSTGMGVVKGSVKRFSSEVKVPQIGWNSVEASENPLFKGVKPGAYFYFVHSYYVPLNAFTIASANYGVEFTAAMQKDNFYACQFHPEKSGETGELILQNFIEICELYRQ